MTNRNPGSIELLATAHGYAGHRAEALRLIDELKRRRKTGHVPAGVFINPYFGLRDYDQAFAGFEMAYQEKSGIMQFLKVHPFFDPCAATLALPTCSTASASTSRDSSHPLG